MKKFTNCPLVIQISTMQLCSYPHVVIVYLHHINTASVWRLLPACLQMEKKKQENKMRRDQLNDEYLELLDKQRLYFKTVKDFKEVGKTVWTFVFSSQRSVKEK